MTIAAARSFEAGEMRPSDRIADLAKFERLPHHSRRPNPGGCALIQGENLEVLRQLEDEFAGSVKCIYIDPPYNNNESYTHYQDRWKHSEWIETLRLRIARLRNFLTMDGSLWVSIDDAEVHHVRLVIEEIFGSDNFVSTIIWNHRKTRENRKVFSNNHEYVLCCARDITAFKRTRNMLPATTKILDRYRNLDNDSRGAWQSISANVQDGHATPAQFYTAYSPTGYAFDPPKGRCWTYNKLRMDREVAAGNIYFGRDGRSAPRIKKFLSEATLGIAPQTLWGADEVGTTESAKRHLMSILDTQAVFDTPKPEQLIHRILAIATNPGELILDAYLGSGTTAAVAHKMGRPYIGIEEGDHALTHSAARLSAIVDGEDGGISRQVNWTSGGGFDVFKACQLVAAQPRRRPTPREISGLELGGEWPATVAIAKNPSRKPVRRSRLRRKLRRKRGEP